MNQAIALLSYVPVRKAASERSEMVTQVLFGETVIVLGTEGSWSNVRVEHDQYEGWCDTKMLTQTENEVSSAEVLYSTILECWVKSESGRLKLSAGSIIRNYDAKTKCFSVAGKEFEVEDDSEFLKNDSMLDLLNKFKSLKGIPYLWGGRTVWGIDCSGLSQVFGRLAGVALPRDASQQVMFGEEVMFIQDAQAGDLAFFGDEEAITHVGIVVEPNKILHASGQVRIDRLDQQGIFDADKGKYSHKLRVIKRLVPEKK